MASAYAKEKARLAVERLAATVTEMGKWAKVETIEEIQAKIDQNMWKEARLGLAHLAEEGERRWADVAAEAIQAETSAAIAVQAAIKARAMSTAFINDDGIISATTTDDETRGTTSEDEDEVTETPQPEEEPNPFVFNEDSESLFGDDEIQSFKHQKRKEAHPRGM